MQSPDDVSQSWQQAFNAHDVTALVGLYDPQAVLWGTLSAELIDTPEGVRAYFERTFANLPDVGIAWGAALTRHFGEVAVSSGHYTLGFTRGGELVTAPARFSFTMRSSAAGWRIVDHHSSLIPAT